jgi:glycosyltransferase involved in cell wall biosynthesis
MHIAFLTPEYPGFKTGKSGGLGTSIKNLTSFLVSKGVKVSIFVYGQREDEIYDEGTIMFYRIKNPYIKGLSWFLTRKKIQRLINEIIQKEHIDLLEVADWTGISAFMNIHCPVLMRLHGSDTFFCHLDHRPIKWWNKLLEKTAYKRADAIIAVSDFVGNTSQQLFSLNRTYTVIPNGIDMKAFQPVSYVSSKPVILYFGTLIRKKGVLEIPFIFNRVLEVIPDAQLILVGADASDILTGNDSTWSLMRPLFKESALENVSYVGEKPYNEIKEHIQQAQVCIFPSYAEALPVSWLEAMAMGKAMVTSDIGWAKEMLTHKKEALLGNPSMHKQFASLIIQLLQDKAFGEELGNNAQKRVSIQFDNLVVAQQNIQYYNKILGSF